jgi:aspartate/methionine/tyrosine aminotransferase
MKPLATAPQEMPRSGIRVVLDLALKIPDAIHLEIGQPNFPTPIHISEAAYRATQEGFTGYAPNAGFQTLREAITEKVNRDNKIQAGVENVVVTTGGMGGLFSSLTTLLDSGDEILLPDPGYPNFEMVSQLCHAKVVRYPLDPQKGFQPILERLPGLVTPRTKAILVNSPSNPTGAVFPVETIQKLVEFANQNNLYLISDESYEKIVFNVAHFSPAAFDTEGRVISIFSFSKTYAMTGWRVGYVIAPVQIASIVAKLQEATVACTSSISQKAAEAALKGSQDCISSMNSAYQQRRDHTLAILNRYNLPSYVPDGAFYLLIDISRTGLDSNVFAQKLLHENKVAVAPGLTFGPGGLPFIRVSLATDEQILSTGIDRICQFILAEKK